MTNELPVLNNSEINYTAIITVLITAISTMFGYHVVNFVKYKKKLKQIPLKLLLMLILNIEKN